MLTELCISHEKKPCLDSTEKLEVKTMMLGPDSFCYSGIKGCGWRGWVVLGGGGGGLSSRPPGPIMLLFEGNKTPRKLY
jgi:hypothetical protein